VFLISLVTVTYAIGVDESVSLSSRADNELGNQNNVFQTEVDEMDFDYIARNPGAVSVFPYSTTSDNSSWLHHFQCSLEPDSTRIFNSDANFAKLFAPTCAEYIAAAFQYWRGTICFKVSIAKTPFHNGRLILSYDPSVAATTDTPYSRIGKAYTTILDISENSSVIVKIPFLSKFDYLSTYPALTTTNDTPNYNFISYGTFSIGALAPLLGPATVDTIVDVVVWKWVEDIELAVPTSVVDRVVGVDTTDPTYKIIIPDTGFYGYYVGTDTSVSELDRTFGNNTTLTFDSSQTAVVTDSGNTTTYTTTMGSFTIGGTLSFQIRQADGTWGTTIVGGGTERLSTLLIAPYYTARVLSNFSVDAAIQINLMNRDEENTIVFNNPKIDFSNLHSLQCIGERILNARQLLRSHREYRFSEADANFIPFTDHPTTLTYLYANNTYVDFFSHLYRFYRGGFSIKLLTRTNDTNTRVKSTLRFRNPINSMYYTGDYDNTPTHVTYPNLNPIHEVRIPYYAQTYRRVICNHSRNDLDYLIPEVKMEMSTIGDIYMAGDDNLSYGWLVGPPTMAQTLMSP